ncbi:MucBP domain-containing protein [Anaerococcus sp. Marseille-P3625]|uniref:MucBP domain-containing protein n=1 Tax=Anaerococcus sp. Marseille-P3625 TaxID=1977277 RepID=UPI0015DF4392|nr:SHIRT domain-containing protein [Anaerococcus sp. Marseille-P3625]
MRRENKNPRKILFSVLIAIAFVVLAGIKLGYANIISPKQGINEYHFYNDTIENKDSAKEIQKQIVLDGKSISDPGHVFKDKDKVLLKWQDEKGNDIIFDTPIDIKSNSKNIIKVYPVFKDQVVVTYYVDDKVYMTDTITDASSYKLPVDPTIYDANKYFVNWSTSKDGSSGLYDENSLKKDIEAGKTDIKLYAITEFKHKATFITGDGASFQEQILASAASTLDKQPKTPERPGYEFSHWSLEEDGEPVDLNTLVLDKDIDVYAVWKPVVVDYKFKVMVQNINDDDYTFHEIISARGLNGEKTSLPFKGSENPDPKVAPTGPIVEDITSLTEKDGRFSNGYNSKDENGKMDHTYTNPQTLDYPGFHLNEEKTKEAFETIEADGSTVVPVYMDRNVHTIWVYKNANKIGYYQANWVNATDENGNIHVDLRYGQSSETWFDKLNKDYIYYMDKSIGSFYTRAPAMGDKDIYMYRVLAKGTKYQLRFVEWDPSKFNAGINSSDLATMQSTLGTMKEIGKRVSFQNSEWYMNWNGRKYRVFEPYNDNYQQVTYSWVDKTDHVDDIKGFEPKKGDMSRDGLQSVNVNNPAFRDYMFAAGKNVGGYQNYTGTPYMEDGNYVGFLFYIRKSYKINYYSGNKLITSKSYKYEADVNDFGLDYKVGETTNPNNPKQIFKGWYKDSSFSVPYTAEDIKTMPAHDTNVYAKWESVEYKVTFHTNQNDYSDDKYIEEVTNIPDSKTVYDGQYKDAKASKENFPQPVQPEKATEFLGWYEKNQYGRYVKANLRKQIKNNDTHLYAKWKYDYLKLKYDLNLPDTDNVEGTAPIDSNSYINDAKAQAQDIGEVKVNGGKKVFVGWSVSKDGSTGLIKPSETVLMDKNKTLYAQWKEMPDLPLTKVTYDPNGGTGKQYTVENIIVEDFHKVLDNDKDENLKYSREGYAFKGWSRDKDATKAEFQAGEEVNVNQLDQDKNNYIYAIWAPIINYTTDGNGQVKEGENFVDSTKEEVELKSNPKGTETKANEGYKFSHWTADKEITLNDGTKIPAGGKITEEQLKQAVITEPLTFKANFVKDEFKVTHEFKVAEDSPIKEMPADVKTAVDAQLPEDKTAEDGKTTTPGELKDPKDVEDKTNDGVWKFEGFKDQDPDTKEVDAKVNGADVTFEGKWKFTPNKHEVTYEYVSGTEGKELPEALKAKAPAKVTAETDDKGNTKHIYKKKTTPTPAVVTEYVDEDGKTIAPKEDGTKPNKEIDGYEFVRTETDDKGNTKHIYKKKTTPTPAVVTEYVDEDGKTIAPKEDGTKPNKEIDGYEFVRTETDDKGNTKHIYKKKTTPTPAVVTEYVDEDGKTIAPKEDGTKPNKEIDGYEFVRTETDDKGNTKHIYKKKTTPTPAVVTEYVDEDGKTIAPKEDGTKPNKEIDGYEFVRTETDDKGNTKHIYKKKTTPTPAVVTEYVDEDGKTIAPKEDGTKPNKEIDGYEFVRTETDDKGNTKHIYKKKTTPTPAVVTEYVDEDGKTIAPKEDGTKPNKEIDGYEFVRTETDDKGNTKHIYKKKTTPTPAVVTEYVDEDGKTIAPKEDGTKPNKEIDGYEFVRTETDDKGNTKHIYKKKTTPTPAVVTEYVDEDGKTIAPKEDGTKPNKEIDGYEFVRTETDDKGNTKHIYKKKTTPTPAVVTEYVDEDGKTIAPKEDGTKPNKEIDGYEFVRTETDDKGNTKHIYKKKTTPTPAVVTEYVDEDGKTIAPKEDGTKPNKEIDGYEFVRTEKDEQGNTKHIYKKKVTPPAEVVTEYVDEDGKTISEKETGTKDKKDIDGYEFVRTEKDEQGNTKHIYKKKTTTPTTDVVTKYVDEAGNPLAQEEKGKKDKKDIPAYEFVKTYTDKDGNTVHVYRLKQSPTPSVETRYVDVNGNQLLPPKDGTNGPETIEGYNFISTSKDGNGNTIHTYSKNPTEGVQTRYVDTEGKQILADKVGTYEPATIKGYEFVNTTTDENGNTTHIYRKLPTPSKKVVTKFVDENGLELSDPLTGKNPSKAIPGYEIVRTETDSNGNVIYVYRKKAKESQKTTKYVDENGNEISESTKGKNPNKDIDGYEFVKTTTDKDGNTVHIYRRKTSTPSVSKTTKYVDEKGNEISESTKGKNPKKDIDGYEFVETTTDKDGNTVHIYKKKSSTSKTKTNFVDEKGNVISPSVDGKNPKKEIEGYEFVKTETDKDGNTVHIYKKKSSIDGKSNVKYKFESSTPGKTLPKEVLDLIPTDVDTIENGSEFSPTKPSKLKVKVKDGTWIFEGFDKESATTDNGELTLVGKWKFVANKKSDQNTKTGQSGSNGSKIKQAGNKNVKTGIADSTNLILVLMGSSFALYKSRKNKY